MAKVVFIHPDLGIGGAERAVIDAALALKSCGHSVEFVTCHHDQNHCFQETKDGSLKVTVVGDWLPRSLFGRCMALCAYLRMIFAAIYLVMFSNIEFDMVFCDQISACIPVLRLSRKKILFYCHFPDMLLTQRQTFLKRLYRGPIDWLEEKTTGLANCILVNSQFTAGVFRDTFSSLSTVQPKVVYPIPDFSAFQKPINPPRELLPDDANIIFLSINRYERKKNLSLAINALGSLKNYVGNLNGIYLVMAGGYDDRVRENVEYYQELSELAEREGLADHVTFLRSFSDAEKLTLLHYSTCLLYTPDKEHFGIVPVEAMYMKCPVIAVASGGPLETVAHQETGYLCQQTADSFAESMAKIVKDPKLKEKLGDAGKARVLKLFSFEAFTNELNSIVNGLLPNKQD